MKVKAKLYYPDSGVFTKQVMISIKKRNSKEIQETLDGIADCNEQQHTMPDYRDFCELYVENAYTESPKEKTWIQQFFNLPADVRYERQLCLSVKRYHHDEKHRQYLDRNTAYIGLISKELCPPEVVYQWEKEIIDGETVISSELVNKLQLRLIKNQILYTEKEFNKLVDRYSKLEGQIREYVNKLSLFEGKLHKELDKEKQIFIKENNLREDAIIEHDIEWIPVLEK